MMAFEPKGDQARWRTLYAMLQDREVGDVITYTVMAEALELDPVADRTTIQLAMRRAAKEYLEVEKRSVKAVSGTGYEVITPQGKLGLARLHQKKAGRSLQRGQSQVVNVDFQGMDPEVRKAFEVMAGAFAAQLDYTRRLDVRQSNLEQAVQAVSDRSDATDAALAELQRRLDALEQRDEPNSTNEDE